MVTKNSAEAPEKNSLPELRRVILAHVGRYPEAEPADLVKLCYQNEFAGGHMISDPGASLRRLIAEMSETPAADVPLLEPIGNGLCRLHLAAAKCAGLSPEEVNDAFCRTANSHRGDAASFAEKLSLLGEMAAEGVFPFPAEDMSAYLAEYVRSGCPAVSHSGRYRESYAPHYRVIAEGDIAEKI